MSLTLNTTLLKKAVANLIAIADVKKSAVIEMHLFKGDDIFLAARNSLGFVASYHLKSKTLVSPIQSFTLDANALLSSINTRSEFTELFIDVEAKVVSIYDSKISFIYTSDKIAFSRPEKEVVEFNSLKTLIDFYRKTGQKDNPYLHLFNGNVLYADPHYLKYYINPVKPWKDCSILLGNLLNLKSFGTPNIRNAETLHYIGFSSDTIQYSNISHYDSEVLRCVVEFPFEKNMRNTAPFEINRNITQSSLDGTTLFSKLNSYLAEVEHVKLSIYNNVLTIEPLYTKLKNPQKVPEPFFVELAQPAEPFEGKFVRKHLLASMIEGSVVITVNECTNVYNETIEVLSFHNNNSKSYLTSIKSPDLSAVATKIKEQLAYQASLHYLNV